MTKSAGSLFFTSFSIFGVLTLLFACHFTQADPVTYTNGEIYDAPNINTDNYDSTNFVITDTSLHTYQRNLSGGGVVNYTGYNNAYYLNLTGDNSAFSGTFNVASANTALWFSSANAGFSQGTLNLGDAATYVRVKLPSNGTIYLGALEGSGYLRNDESADNVTVTYEIGGANKDASFSGRIMDKWDGHNVNVYTAVKKVGTGTQTLSGNNTYTGGTTISGGTLAISSVNALGTGAVTIDGGALDASPAGKSKTFPNSLVIGANGGTVTTATGDYSSFASISGSGDLTTSGYVHFNGTGGYSGHLTVNSGFTRINPGAFGVFDLTLENRAQFNVFESGTVQIGKLNSTTDSCLFGSSGSNTYVYEIGVGTASTDTASYSGSVRGSSNGAYNVTLKKVGAGTQTFNRTGYGYAGTPNSIKDVIIDGGTMVINATHSVFSASSTTGFWGTTPITINVGGTLVYDHAWNTSPNTMLTINGGTLTLNQVQYQNAITFNSGTVSGESQLRVGYVGSGNWTVTGGTTTINNPVVAVKSGDYTTFTINIADGATLDIKKNISGLGGYVGTDVVVNGSGANGSGKIIFNPSGSNYATNMGTVSFNHVNVELATNKNWLDNGFFGGSAVTLTDSTMTTKSDHGLNGTVLTLDASSLIYDGAINSYAHQVTLKNGSTISGTTAGSEFRTGHNWNSQFFTVYDEGAEENVMNTISANISMYNTGRTMTFNIADKAPLTFSGSFVPAGSGHYNALVKTGAGTLTLTGANRHGTTTVSEGTLVVAGNGTLGLKTTTVEENGTLEFNVADGQEKTLTTAATDKNITGSGTVTKSGKGLLKIDAPDGAVNVGNLVVAEGRLDMEEYLTGNMTVNNGAEFSPGNSIGTLNVDGNFTLGEAGGSGDPAKLIMEIGGAGSDENDALIVSGDLTLNNGIVYLELADTCDMIIGDRFNAILSAGNSDSLSGLNIQADGFSNFDYRLLDSGLYAITGVFGSADQIPEPSTWLLLFLGVFGVLCWRKRK